MLAHLISEETTRPVKVKNDPYRIIFEVTGIDSGILEKFSKT